MHGGKLVVSWGGISDWEILNAAPCPDPSVVCTIADMAVGRFFAHSPGDARDDIFYASGPTPNVPSGAWYLSYGGSAPFNLANTSSFRRKDLRFGDFDGDGITDVFAAVSGTWSYSRSATGSWADGVLQDPAPTPTVVGLVVADFNGDGLADVGTSCGHGCWKISLAGTQSWAATNFGSFDLVNGGVGHFAQTNCGSAPGADLLVWNGNEFSVVRCGAESAFQISTQDMR
jgi:hypothetical protein